MKRIILAFSLMCLASVAFAKQPALALEKLFDGRYNDNPKVEWSKIKRDGEVAYYMDFKNDPAIVKEVLNAMTKDMNGEEFDTEIITKDQTFYRTEIKRNGCNIDVGFSIPRKGNCSLYIRGPRKAFE